jgi:hypothetical protein
MAKVAKIDSRRLLQFLDRQKETGAVVEEMRRSSKAGVMSSPAWHEDVLAERDAMQKREEDKFEDWEATKRSIRSKV